MKSISKETIDFYFKTSDKDMFTCICGARRKCKKGAGYSNLYSHIQTAHPNHQQEVSQFRAANNLLITSMLDSKAINSFGWISCIVENNFPLSFVESESVRKQSKLRPISCETLKKQMFQVQSLLQQKIKDGIPDKFGLVFDGWSSNGIHFVSLFCVFSNSTKDFKSPVLLKFSPLENEEDLGADSHLEFIIDSVESYGKTRANILFLVSDNCAVNIAVSTRSGIPLIGCASHRFNLAMKSFLEPFDTVIKKVNEIMKKFCTIKGKAWLKNKTSLRSVTKNSTRWYLLYVRKIHNFQTNSGSGIS